jgi:hypothetical protein
MVMKKASGITLFIVVTMAVCCQKDSQPKPDSAEDLVNQNALIAKSTWKVSCYVESGKEMTSDFSTYLFKFVSDGSVAVHSAGIDVLCFGMWNLVKAMHNQSYSFGESRGETMINKMLITLPGNDHVAEVCENWEITRLADSEIWPTAVSSNYSKAIHFICN